MGMWRRRAEALKRLSMEMARRNGRLPKDRAELESLPAVGQYVVNAILLLCWNKPEPLLDVNMARVLERHFEPRKIVDIRCDPYLQTLSRFIICFGDAKKINWGVLDVAAEVCRKKSPRCDVCPVKESCRYYGDSVIKY